MARCSAATKQLYAVFENFGRTRTDAARIATTLKRAPNTN